MGNDCKNAKNLARAALVSLMKVKFKFSQYKKAENSESV